MSRFFYIIILIFAAALMPLDAFGVDRKFTQPKSAPAPKKNVQQQPLASPEMQMFMQYQRDSQRMYYDYQLQLQHQMYNQQLYQQQYLAWRKFWYGF